MSEKNTIDPVDYIRSLQLIAALFECGLSVEQTIKLSRALNTDPGDTIERLRQGAQKFKELKSKMPLGSSSEDLNLYRIETHTSCTATYTVEATSKKDARQRFEAMNAKEIDALPSRKTSAFEIRRVY